MYVCTVTPDLSETGLSEQLIYPTAPNPIRPSCVQSNLVYPTHFIGNRCGPINEGPLDMCMTVVVLTEHSVCFMPGR